MKIETLNRDFAIPRIAEIVAGNGGLPKVYVTTANASAEIYLHGAQVTSWRPTGGEDLIFLSEHAQWQEGRAIRGGIPICFPWFNAKADDAQAPSHGFVRTTAWELTSIAQPQEDVIVKLQTTSNAASRRWWPHEFRLLHRITVGAELKLELTMTNTDATPLRFEEALHTYHRVGDVEKIRIAGLDGVDFLDHVEGNRKKKQDGDLTVAGPTDNIYLETRHSIEILDPALQRRVNIQKKNSLTTVTWNPWKEGTAALNDLGDKEWHTMVCVEASNVRDAAITLEPGESHTMEAILSVAGLGS